ncbi:MAG: aspartyl protease family protein [Gammaproteobacteria bacterium]|nr:aspartyl protease family protein [Gammaproteobacteria bacterium]
MMREFFRSSIRPAASLAALAALVALADPNTTLTPILVQATGPRFVAPTRRDSIGRIWAPVFIDGQGPFRLVLDTGATQSGVTATVASILHLPLGRTPPVLLRGVTGVATVPTVRLDELAIGDLTVAGAVVPILPDAFGGADGVLGTAGLADKRVFIDFRRDRITITYSHGRYPSRGFETLHFLPNLQTPIIVDARVGGVLTKAIIDTGGQMTIANDALRDALMHRWFHPRARPDRIEGATRAVQRGEMIATPMIDLGAITIRDPYITYSNLMIFEHWHLVHRPAILIGMDALGTLDQLVIDYRRHELELRPRTG